MSSEKAPDEPSLELVNAVADAIARNRGYIAGAATAEHYDDARAALAAVRAHQEADAGSAPEAATLPTSREA